MHTTTTLSLALGLASVPLVAGHPGEDHHNEAIKRRAFLKDNAANLDHCAAKLDALGVTERSIQRRQARIQHIREKRGLVARGEHEQRSYDAGLLIRDEDELRGNSSCVLSPEEILGPYYVAGEAIRSNVTEGQPGVPVHLDISFFNSATCKPVIDSWVDIWQANATGAFRGFQTGAKATHRAPG